MTRTLCVAASIVFLSGCAAHQSGLGGPHANHRGHSKSTKAKGGPVHWRSLAEGKQEAWVQEKPMLVEFYVPEGCDRCDRMDEEVYSQAEIAAKINQEFVPVRIDLTGNMTREEVDLGRLYEYDYECLLLFLDHEGEVIENAGGGRMCFAEFVTAGWFVKYLDRATEVAISRSQSNLATMSEPGLNTASPAELRMPIAD